MKEDLSISIGDFGVATIMGDTRTKTRTVIGKFLVLKLYIFTSKYSLHSYLAVVFIFWFIFLLCNFFIIYYCLSF